MLPIELMVSSPRTSSLVPGSVPNLSVGHFGAHEVDADHRAVFDDDAGRHPKFLELEQKLAHRFFRDLRACVAHRLLPLGWRIGRNIRKRHIDHAPAIESLHGLIARSLLIKPMRLDTGSDALALQPHHVFGDAARGRAP